MVRRTPLCAGQFFQTKRREGEMTRHVTITSDDRRRLGTMLESAQTLGRVERELLDAIEADVDGAVAADPADVPPDLVTMNSTVELRDMGSGEIETYTLVYPERADVTYDRVSVLAPLGRAILGTKVGEIVTVQAPSGWRRIRVESIPYQPERAGDYHL
jgi:regulator of nucleoside diphosphate kinase